MLRKPRRHRATQAHSRITTATSLLSHLIASSSVVRASQNSVYTTATAHTAPRLPQVRSICEAKGAPGCEECMASWRAGKTWGDCDLLSVYSRLCSSSPGAACVAALQYITGSLIRLRLFIYSRLCSSSPGAACVLRHYSTSLAAFIGLQVESEATPLVERL